MKLAVLSAVALAALSLPSLASAQSSWDVTIAGTGTIAVANGTYRLPARPAPFGPLRFGVECKQASGLRLTIGVWFNPVFNNSSAAVTVERESTLGRRFETVSEAAVKTPGPGQSFSGTVATGDGVVTINVVANP